MILATISFETIAEIAVLSFVAGFIAALAATAYLEKKDKHE